MSRITLSGNASGTGNFTLASPNSNTDRTLTLPDATGTVNVSGLANEVPAGSAGAPAIYPTGDSNTGIFFPAADTVGFSAGGTERVRIDANGIKFNGDTASANALDDYEEGTWTASCSIGTCVGAGTTYTKVGNLVTIVGRVNTFSNTGVAGMVAILGIPFSVSGEGVGSMFARNLNQVTECAVYASGGSLNFYGVYTGAYDPLLHTDLTASSEIYFSVTYRTT
jgi:hypothetical protein